MLPLELYIWGGYTGFINHIRSRLRSKYGGMRESTEPIRRVSYQRGAAGSKKALYRVKICVRFPQSF